MKKCCLNHDLLNSISHCATHIIQIRLMRPGVQPGIRSILKTAISYYIQFVYQTCAYSLEHEKLNTI